ncbi:MAG: DEAD/DEAH box helicase [Planctomycetota bacterium]
MEMLSFHDLNLIDPLLRAVKQEGYLRPTPIQQQAIPHVLAGKDILGCAQTGTGKTAAFALPILQRLHGGPSHGHHVVRALILTPTRELAAQIDDSFAAYGKFTNLRHTVVYGGVSQHPQTQALQRGVDILVATPGRLLDLMSQTLVHFRGLEIFVLDEADRMLDMGFIPDVRRIVAALPKKRQTLFFSATLPPDIQRLAGTIVTDPVRVEVTPAATTVEAVEQKIYFVEKADKRELLVELLKDPTIVRALVFTRTKHGADRVERQLHRAGIGVAVIHGNKTQGARERAFDHFKTGKSRILVATDIAARGIDIDDISHVFNFDMPDEPDAYVHRIGRTARAGAGGMAIAFCSFDERSKLRAIERLIRLPIPVAGEYRQKTLGPPPEPPPAAKRAIRKAHAQAHAPAHKPHHELPFGHGV